jgi:hypothetical protein
MPSSVRMFGFVLGMLAAGALPTAATAQNEQSRTPALDRLEYKGFVVNVSPIQSAPNRDALLTSLRRQFDIVTGVGLDEATLDFFRSNPIVIDSASAADPAYKGTAARYARKFKPIPKQGVPGTMTIVPGMYNPTAPIFLHELLHAFHDQKLPGAYDNPEILRFFEEAREKHLFPDTSYMMLRVNEYFAMVGSAYLYGSVNRDPFTRENLETRQLDIYAWFVKEFGRR